MNYQRLWADFSLRPKEQRKSTTQLAGNITPEANTAEIDDLHKNNHLDKAWN